MQKQALQWAKNKVPGLAIVPAVVFKCERLSVCEDRQDILESNAVLFEVPLVLTLVPLEHAVMWPRTLQRSMAGSDAVDAPRDRTGRRGCVTGRAAARRLPAACSPIGKDASRYGADDQYTEGWDDGFEQCRRGIAAMMLASGCAARTGTNRCRQPRRIEVPIVCPCKVVAIGSAPAPAVAW
jgi:hypothetical protein